MKSNFVHTHSVQLHSHGLHYFKCSLIFQICIEKCSSSNFKLVRLFTKSNKNPRRRKRRRKKRLTIDRKIFDAFAQNMQQMIKSGIDRILWNDINELTLLSSFSKWGCNLFHRYVMICPKPNQLYKLYKQYKRHVFDYILIHNLPSISNSDVVMQSKDLDYLLLNLLRMW